MGPMGPQGPHEGTGAPPVGPMGPQGPQRGWRGGVRGRGEASGGERSGGVQLWTPSLRRTRQNFEVSGKTQIFGRTTNPCFAYFTTTTVTGRLALSFSTMKYGTVAKQLPGARRGGFGVFFVLKKVGPASPAPNVDQNPGQDLTSGVWSDVGDLD